MARGKSQIEGVRDRVLLLVRGGNHLSTALGACGVTRQTLHDWRSRATAGNKKYQEFFEAVQRAIDEGECNDVVTTARAANLDAVRVPCQRCGASLSVTSDQLVALAGDVVTGQSLKMSAASVAFQRLALRNPARWSPRVTLTVEDEHNRLFDVAQRVLAPEVFELLLDAYIASGSREGTQDGAPGQPPTERVH
jgi:hypothetical protein